LRYSKDHAIRAAAEHYINYISFFVKYLGYEDPEVALVDMRSGKVDAQKKIDEYIDYALDEMPNKQKPDQEFRGFLKSAPQLQF